MRNPVLFVLLLVCGALADDDLLAKARKAFTGKNFDEAIRLYTQIIGTDKAPSESHHFLRASAYEASARYEDAIADYVAVVEAADRHKSTSPYRKRAQGKLSDLCISVCHFNCLARFPAAAFDEARVTDIRAASAQAPRVPSMTIDALREFSYKCTRNPLVFKRLLLHDLVHQSDHALLKQTFDRIKILNTDRFAAGGLRQLSEAYDFLSMLDEGEYGQITAKAKKALASNPDNALLSGLFKLSRSLTQVFESYDNATPISHKLNKARVEAVAASIDGIGALLDRVLGRVQAAVVASIRDVFAKDEDFLSERFTAQLRESLTFARTRGQIENSLDSLRCLNDLFFHSYNATLCAYSAGLIAEDSKVGEAEHDAFKDLSTRNRYLLSLIYSLRANLQAIDVNRRLRTSEAGEDEIAAAEKLINTAMLLIRDVRRDKASEGLFGHLDKFVEDLVKVSDQIFELSKRLVVPDFYAVLGVRRSTPLAEIKKKYYRLAKDYHPDYTPADATEDEKARRNKKFQRIAEAWDVLSDKDKRAQYDSNNYLQEEINTRTQHHENRKRQLLSDPSQQGTNGFQQFGGGNPFQHFQQGGQQFFQFGGQQFFFRQG